MRAVAVALAPVLLVQGAEVRRRTPVLPEAAGPRSRTVPGNGPPLTVANQPVYVALRWYSRPPQPSSGNESEMRT